MVGFYKHDIPAWMDGTEGLSDGAYRVYHVVVQLIMLNEGPIVRNDRGLAGRANQTLGSFSRHIEYLLTLGKLVMVGDKIGNARADRELVSIRQNRANAGKGGKISGNLRKTRADSNDATAKPLKNKDSGEASLNNLRSLKEKRREDIPVVPKGTDPEGFAEFWKAYPKRDGDNPRKTAIKAYAKVIGGGVEPAALLRAVKAMAAEMQVKGRVGSEFVPQATTWLNQGRFERFTAPATGGADGTETDPAVRLSKMTDEEWRTRVHLWKSRCGYWPWGNLTPAPNDPRTKVPKHILAEVGVIHGSRDTEQMRAVG